MSAARGGRRPGHRKIRKPSPKFRGGPVKQSCLLLVVALPALVAVWFLVWTAEQLISLPLVALLAP